MVDTSSDGIHVDMERLKKGEVKSVHFRCSSDDPAMLTVIAAWVPRCKHMPNRNRRTNL